MKAHEMRKLANEELSERIVSWEQEHFRARCEQAVGQLTDINRIKTLRRDIARGKTIRNEKNRHVASQD